MTAINCMNQTRRNFHEKQKDDTANQTIRCTKLNAEIRAFYLDERGEEIGIIEQMQLLELFEQKMAPIIYNRALDDARQWFTQMMENVDSDYYTLYKVEN